MTDYHTKAETAAPSAFADIRTPSAFEETFSLAQAEALAPRLDALDAGLAALEHTVERKMAALVAAGRRPPLIATKAGQGDEAHRAAFSERYLRKGLETGLAGLEAKALTIATPAEGGYAVPEVIDQAIESRLKSISPLRDLATVVTVGSANYKKLVATSGIASGWVAESAARPETTAPQFAEVAPPWGEIYANPAATQAMLDDAMFDVEGWLAGEIALEFARQEGAAFITGNGSNKPKGFLSYATAATGDTVRAFGTLQHVPTGVAGNFPASDPADLLIDLVHALRPAYRQGAAFVMNSATCARLRKFKDGDGNFIWRPSLAEGQPATLLGYPVHEAEDMPDVAADALAIAFGNFAHGYVIAERAATRILRDPFSNKPFVHFYATRRVGGAVVNSDAIKLLKFAVS